MWRSSVGLQRWSSFFSWFEKSLLMRNQVQRAAEEAIAEIEWSDDGATEEDGDGELI